VVKTIHPVLKNSGQNHPSPREDQKMVSDVTMEEEVGVEVVGEEELGPTRRAQQQGSGGVVALGELSGGATSGDDGRGLDCE
jgi:hypothetical protein